MLSSTCLLWGEDFGCALFCDYIDSNIVNLLHYVHCPSIDFLLLLNPLDTTVQPCVHVSALKIYSGRHCVMFPMFSSYSFPLVVLLGTF